MNLSKISKKRLGTYTAEEARALLHEGIRRAMDLRESAMFAVRYTPEYVVYNALLKMERAYRALKKVSHLISVLMASNAGVVPTLIYARFLEHQARAYGAFDRQYDALKAWNEPMSRHLSDIIP